MTISVTALSVLVSIATVITMLAPLVLVVLWIRDWLKGNLW
jgi:hypothetical protein